MTEPTPKKKQSNSQKIEQDLKNAAEKSNENIKALKRELQRKQKKVQYQKEKEMRKAEKVYRKSAMQQYTKEENEDIDVPVDGELEKGSRVFMSNCFSCHTLDPYSTDGGRGPALGLIFNRRVGADQEYDGYSDAMLNSDKFWTARNLYNFMAYPKSVVPGTICSISRGVGLHSEQDRADLLVFLREYTAELSKNMQIKEVKSKGYSQLQTQIFADEFQRLVGQSRQRGPR